MEKAQSMRQGEIRAKNCLAGKFASFDDSELCDSRIVMTPSWNGWLSAGSPTWFDVESRA
jgi:hypothetical protein